MNTETTAQDQGLAAGNRTVVTRAVTAFAAAAALAALSACGGGSSGPGIALLPAAPPPAPAPAPPAADGPMVRLTAAGKVEGVDDSAPRWASPSAARTACS